MGAWRSHNSELSSITGRKMQILQIALSAGHEAFHGRGGQGGGQCSLIRPPDSEGLDGWMSISVNESRPFVSADVCIYTCRYAYIVHVYIYIYTYMDTYVYMHACMLACVHTYIHAYIVRAF